MSAQTTLTIALSKGRIFKETVPLLKNAGIEIVDDPVTSRKLILATNHEHIKVVVIRATDVPTYVQYGAADIGVTGKDVLMEHGGADLYELVDLKIAPCRMMVAGPVDAVAPTGRLRIATKYVNIAKNYYAKQGKQVELIKLYGAMELAPLADLSDYIVDLVDTGNTLKANGLVPMDHIADISSRLVVNKASMKMKHAVVKQLVDQLEAAVA
ncbi:MAG: ATP phosphoribosyltransferase [Gammaproteobacteria bacterium]|nr:ATP phosphoribosyltransferase [Gammaproteobacteria bacterium]